jgi:hypothetical protein
MAIVKFPSGMAMPPTLICVLCDRRILPAEAVTGQPDAGQNQVVACLKGCCQVTRQNRQALPRVSKCPGQRPALQVHGHCRR